jgi:hypothetical protein
MFWIALAAQISAPIPETPTSWFSPNDMPIYLLQEGSGFWQVPIRVNVRPDGKVRSCDVEAAGGVPDLNELTCRLIMRRAKFQPARIEGIPSAAVYRTSIMWVVADAPWDTSKAINADVDVAIERLPTGLKSPTFVRVMFAVDTMGSKSSCAADTSKGLQRIENHPALVPVACQQIMEMYRASPATDVTGRPVLSVQSALVRFSAP